MERISATNCSLLLVLLLTVIISSLVRSELIIFSDRTDIKLLETNSSLTYTIVKQRDSHSVYNSIDYYYEREVQPSDQLVQLVWLETTTSTDVNGSSLQQQRLYTGRLNITSRKLVQPPKQIVTNQDDLLDAQHLIILRAKISSKPEIYVASTKANYIRQFNLIESKNGHGADAATTNLSLRLVIDFNVSSSLKSFVIDPINGSYIAWLDENNCVHRLLMTAAAGRHRSITYGTNSLTSQRTLERYCFQPSSSSLSPLPSSSSELDQNNITAISVTRNFLYFIMSNGEVYRKGLNALLSSDISSNSLPRPMLPLTQEAQLIIPADAYGNASHMFAYYERRPFALHVSELRDRIDVYVGDNKHHILFHFRVRLGNVNGESGGEKSYLVDRSKIVTNEDHLVDFKILKKINRIGSVNGDVSGRQDVTGASDVGVGRMTDPLTSNDGEPFRYRLKPVHLPDSVKPTVIVVTDDGDGSQKFEESEYKLIKRVPTDLQNANGTAAAGNHDKVIKFEKSNDTILKSRHTLLNESESNSILEHGPSQSDGNTTDDFQDKSRVHLNPNRSISVEEAENNLEKHSNLSLRRNNFDISINGDSLNNESRSLLANRETTNIREDDDNLMKDTSWFWYIFTLGIGFILVFLILIASCRVARTRWQRATAAAVANVATLGVDSLRGNRDPSEQLLINNDNMIDCVGVIRKSTVSVYDDDDVSKTYNSYPYNCNNRNSSEIIIDDDDCGRPQLTYSQKSSSNLSTNRHATLSTNHVGSMSTMYNLKNEPPNRPSTTTTPASLVNDSGGNGGVGRKPRSYSGRQNFLTKMLRPNPSAAFAPSTSEQHHRQALTAVSATGIVSIEDMGGFCNPDFAFDTSSPAMTTASTAANMRTAASGSGNGGGHKVSRRRACDVCDYKGECYEKGVCLSTFRLLTK